MEKLLCGVDLGGTKLSAGLVQPDGTLVDCLTTYDHVNKDEDGIINDIAVIVNDLLEKNNLTEEDLLGMGVVFPGHINGKEGRCITTSNFKAKFKNYPFRDNIQKYFRKVKITVDNDANAQAYAEYKYGAGKNHDDMVFITVSTGIGAGIIIGGKLIRGMSGTAGEIGHTIIDPDSAIKCTCGNYGCLMTYGGRLLPERAAEKLRKGVPTNLGINLKNYKTMVTGHSIGRGLDIDDPLAKAVVFECADALGIALYNLFQLLNPSLVVLGGGLINWGDIYINRVKETLYSMAGDMMVEKMEIVTAELAEHAGVLGASALCLEFPDINDKYLEVRNNVGLVKI
jgi:glucokinase